MEELCKQHADYDKWLVVRTQCVLRSYFNAEGKYSVETKLSSPIYAP
jgi:hypothetical protein